MEMSSDETPDLLELFATSAKDRPQRTYSHKGRDSRAVSLPALKPTLDVPPSANPGVKFRAFRIGHAKSVEIKTVRDCPPKQLPSLRAQQVAANGDGIGHEHDARHNLPQEGAGERDSSHAVDPDDVTSPVTPSSHSQFPDDLDESEAAEREEDDDEDDIIILSQRPLGSTPKHDRRTGNGTRSLRRRPFLVFDRTEAKGYKQLKAKPQAAKTLPELRYRPGDGFSGREAKPSGSTLLTRTGKLSVTGAHVGILDLTQSDLVPAKKKRGVRRANLDDNSFLAAPKKKARRPLQPKDPNQRPKAITAAPVLVKKSSSVLDVAEKAGVKTASQKPENGHTRGNQLGATWDEDGRSHPNSTQQLAQNDEDHDDVDMLIIQRSDGIEDEPGTITDRHGVAAEEGQDSCGTHVTDSPERQLRIRARSVSPESPRRRRFYGAEGSPVSGRVFRRSNTQ